MGANLACIASNCDANDLMKPLALLHTSATIACNFLQDSRHLATCQQPFAMSVYDDDLVYL